MLLRRHSHPLPPSPILFLQSITPAPPKPAPEPLFPADPSGRPWSSRCCVDGSGAGCASRGSAIDLPDDSAGPGVYQLEQGRGCMQSPLRGPAQPVTGPCTFLAGQLHTNYSKHCFTPQGSARTITGLSMGSKSKVGTDVGE